MYKADPRFNTANNIMEDLEKLSTKVDASQMLFNWMSGINLVFWKY